MLLTPVILSHLHFFPCPSLSSGMVLVHTLSPTSFAVTGNAVQAVSESDAAQIFQSSGTKLRRSLHCIASHV